MKSLLLVILSLCFVVNVVALTPSFCQAPLKIQPADGAGLTTMLGTVQDGDKLLRFVTVQRAWNVDNPETLEGHEGHYLRVRAYVDSDRDSIHITEMILPTATEIRKDNAK